MNFCELKVFGENWFDFFGRTIIAQIIFAERRGLQETLKLQKLR